MVNLKFRINNFEHSLFDQSYFLPKHSKRLDLNTYSARNWRRPFIVAFRHQLVVLAIGEADEGKVISGEGFRGRETLDRSFVLDVVEVPGVVVAGQLVNDGRNVFAYRPEIPNVVFEERVVPHLVHALVTESTCPEIETSFLHFVILNV